MVITLDNYEAFALDYIEGNLAPDIKAAFEAFLVGYPTIAEEIEGMTTLPVLIADQSIGFQDKKSLLKNSFGNKLLPMWSRRKSLGVAASILLLLGIGVYFASDKEIGVTLEWNDEKLKGHYSLEVDTVKDEEEKVATRAIRVSAEGQSENQTTPSQTRVSNYNTSVASSGNQSASALERNTAKKSLNLRNNSKPTDMPTKPIAPAMPLTNTQSDNVAEAQNLLPNATTPSPARPESSPATEQPQSAPVVAQTVSPQTKPATSILPSNPPNTNASSTPPLAQTQPTEKPKTKFWNKVRDALLPEIVSENDRPIAKIQLPKVKFNFD